MAKANPERHVGRKLLKNPLILMASLLAAWLAVLCVVGDNGLTTLNRCSQMIRNLEVENEALRNRNADLTEDIKCLKDDNDTIEAVAREELLLVRPGERIIYIQSH
ncbi:septum formation initiator family protein [Acidobacteriota bacterium]